jgi:hypothetical protein
VAICNKFFERVKGYPLDPNTGDLKIDDKLLRQLESSLSKVTLWEGNAYMALKGGSNGTVERFHTQLITDGTSLRNEWFQSQPSWHPIVLLGPHRETAWDKFVNFLKSIL